MKTIIRAFVLVLAVTGAAASTQTTSYASVKTIASSVQPSIMPVPTCEPDGSYNNCNIRGK